MVANDRQIDRSPRVVVGGFVFRRVIEDKLTIVDMEHGAPHGPIKLIGDGPQSLYFIDKELELINEIQEKEAEQEG